MRLNCIVSRLRCPCRSCRELRREEQEERERSARVRALLSDPDVWERWAQITVPASARGWTDAVRAKLTEYEHGTE